MHTPLENNQLRQYIDAEQARKAWLLAERRVGNYRGSMYWRTVKDRDYLFREYSKGHSKGLGARSPENEKILDEFKKGKLAAEQNYKSLATSIATHERLNVALRVGRTPSIVVGLLEEIRKAGVQDHFLVIGTNALYAYETHAGVRLDGDVTSTTDMDLLWDSRKRITLVSDGDEQFSKHGLIGVLRRFDKSFEMMEDRDYSAANSKGYIVDLIKRRPESMSDDKEHPQLIPNPEDFWASKIKNMDWLLSSPRFKQIVVGENGVMAEMTTVDPRAFVLYKAWLSQKEDRDPMKKPRDLAQAQAVYELVQDRLPHLGFDKIQVLPERMRNERAFAMLTGKKIDN